MRGAGCIKDFPGHQCGLVWVAVPVRGAGCISSGNFATLYFDSCCPREGCGLHHTRSYYDPESVPELLSP